MPLQQELHSLDVAVQFERAVPAAPQVFIDQGYMKLAHIV